MVCFLNLSETTRSCMHRSMRAHTHRHTELLLLLFLFITKRVNDLIVFLDLRMDSASVLLLRLYILNDSVATRYWVKAELLQDSTRENTLLH